MRRTRGLIGAFGAGLLLAGTLTGLALAALRLTGPAPSSEISANREGLPPTPTRAADGDGPSHQVAIPDAASRAGEAAPEVTLTRAIQRELTRVGCYTGEVAGQWDERTRAAAENFASSRSIRAETSAPDHLLLRSLEADPGTDCIPTSRFTSATGSGDGPRSGIPAPFLPGVTLLPAGPAPARPAAPPVSSGGHAIPSSGKINARDEEIATPLPKLPPLPSVAGQRPRTSPEGGKRASSAEDSRSVFQRLGRDAP